MLSVFLSGAFGLAGCKSTPDTIAAPALSQIKTVGVISAVGSALSYNQIGITVFSNDTNDLPAFSYGIDPYVTGLVTKALGGRYTVKPVKYSAEDFRQDKIAVTAGAETFGSGEPVGGVIRAKAMPNDLDAYVVVVGTESGVKNSNQVVQGLGITRRAMAFYHEYWAHALYGIAVVDGHSGQVLAWQAAPGGQQELDFLEVPAVNGPYKNADETYWPEDVVHAPPAQVQKLADLMKQLIANSLPQTLKAVNLLQ